MIPPSSTTVPSPPQPTAAESSELVGNMTSSSVRNPVGTSLHSQGPPYRQVQTRATRPVQDGVRALRRETGRGKGRRPGECRRDARSPDNGLLSKLQSHFWCGRYVCFKVSQAGGADGGEWGWRLPLASHGQMRCQRWCFGTGREWASTLCRGKPKALGSLGRCQEAQEILS